MPSIVRIDRPPQWSDALLAYVVMLDGEVVCTIKNGETIDLDVKPGPHRLQLAVRRFPFRTDSRVVEFSVADECVTFECGPALTATQLGMLGALAGQSGWLGRVGALIWATAFTWRIRHDDPRIRLAAPPDDMGNVSDAPEDERRAYVRLMDAVHGRD